MPKFALRYPFFIIMLCLMVSLVGVVNTARMPVDLFPKDRYACRSGGDVLQRYAAASRSKPTLRILLSASLR